MKNITPVLSTLLIALASVTAARANENAIVFTNDFQPASIGPEKGLSIEGIYRFVTTFTPAAPRLVSIQSWREEENDNPNHHVPAHCETSVQVSVGQNKIDIYTRDGAKLLGTSTQELILTGERSFADDGVCAARWAGVSYSLVNRSFQDVVFAGITGGTNQAKFQVIVGNGVLGDERAPTMTGAYQISRARWFAGTTRTGGSAYGGMLTLYTPQAYQAMRDAIYNDIDDRI